jgi:hypothetical protein
MDLQTALNAYGFVGDLANSIPELKSIFAQAAQEEWAPAQFERAVMDSKWYRSNAETVRFHITQQKTDPATWRQTLGNGAEKVYLLQREMGLVPNGPERRQQIAQFFLYNNYDDEQIRRWLAQHSQQAVNSEGAFAGQAAELEEHMRQVATNYGVSATSSFLRAQVKSIQAGEYNLEGFESLMRARAKAAFPQFAQQLDSGLTVRDIADPYISTMANTLEIAETELDLTDRNVKMALSQRQSDGSMGSMPLWEFERKLKDDPRWDKTKQAREQAFSAIATIGRDFGFEAA